MNNRGKCIALTFDDGPNTDITPLVLEKLEKYGIVASFFLVGRNINDQSAEILKKACALGCELCNHSRTHPDMSDFTAEQVREEVGYTSEKIKSIAGYYPRFFRPPYIAISGTMLDNIDMTFAAGLGVEDWDPKISAEEIAHRVIAQVKDGDIVLLHDMSGNTRTVNALDRIIPQLLSNGYRFVTVSGLFIAKGVEPKPNVIYSNAMQEAIF